MSPSRLVMTYTPSCRCLDASHQVFLMRGSTVSQSDLENAGIRTAKAVLVMKDSK